MQLNSLHVFKFNAASCPQRPRFESTSALLSLQNCGLWTLSCDFVPNNYETLKKMALIAAHLNAGVILVVTV